MKVVQRDWEAPESVMGERGGRGGLLYAAGVATKKAVEVDAVTSDHHGAHFLVRNVAALTWLLPDCSHASIR